MNCSKRLLLLSTTPFLLTASLLYGQAPPAPVWAVVAPESVTIAVVLPAGATYRFGDSINNKWSAPITVEVATTFSPVSQNAGVFPFSDRDTGVVKELDVLKTSTPQVVMVTNLAASPATTVSQIVPPLVGPASVPVLSGASYTLTFSNFTIAPGTPANAQMVAFVNAPPSNANRTWEGTQMDMTIDGVTMVCTPSLNNTDQTFNMNCVVPSAATTGQ
jgi:hypothetical protein